MAKLTKYLYFSCALTTCGPVRASRCWPQPPLGVESPPWNQFFPVTLPWDTWDTAVSRLLSSHHRVLRDGWGGGLQFLSPFGRWWSLSSWDSNLEATPASGSQHLPTESRAKGMTLVGLRPNLMASPHFHNWPQRLVKVWSHLEPLNVRFLDAYCAPERPHLWIFWDHCSCLKLCNTCAFCSRYQLVDFP